MALANTTPSQDTLDRTPGRALTFLLAVGRTPAIRGALQGRGYSDDEHAGGWAKLLAVDPSMAKSAPGVTSADPAVSEAFAKVDKWDNENLPIADVALAARAPEAHAILFADGLAPADGAESVRVVTTFLDRVDEIEAHAAEKPGKKGAKADATDSLSLTAAQAKAAIELLHARGITAEVRKTVRGWLTTLQKGAEVRPVATSRETAESRRAATLALYHWLNEWSLIARKVISRRDHLVSLGLATRKSRVKKPDAKKPDAPK
jgi:hypothetical protein